MSEDPEQKRLDTVHNERTKLTATYANGIAIAIFAVGAFAPLISAFNQGQAHISTLLLMLVCAVLSGTLHWIGRAALRGMK